jgi:hypothetical protein
MKLILTKVLLLLTLLQVNAQKGCYDFSKKYENFIKLGVGKTLIPVSDVDGRIGTVVFVEGEIPKFTLGLHTNIRTGRNYISNIADNVPVSIDSRFVGLKNYKKHIQYGPYVQLNSTGMWADGLVAGGVVRVRHEVNNFGFFAEASVPVFGYHRKALSSNSYLETTSWFDTRIDPLTRTRSTEYRITLAAYLKLNFY